MDNAKYTRNTARCKPHAIHCILHTLYPLCTVHYTLDIVHGAQDHSAKQYTGPQFTTVYRTTVHQSAQDHSEPQCTGPKCKTVHRTTYRLLPRATLTGIIGRAGKWRSRVDYQMMGFSLHSRLSLCPNYEHKNRNLTLYASMLFVSLWMCLSQSFDNLH